MAETTIHKRSSHRSRSKKIIAATQEPIVAVEVVVKPVEVQLPALAIPVEVSHVAAAIVAIVVLQLGKRHDEVVHTAGLDRENLFSLVLGFEQVCGQTDTADCIDFFRALHHGLAANVFLVIANGT